jgi:hypothetical protein
MYKTNASYQALSVKASHRQLPPSVAVFLGFKFQVKKALELLG